VPGVVDLSEVVSESKGVSCVVLEAVQEMMLRVALQIAREDYEDRRERQRQGRAGHRSCERGRQIQGSKSERWQSRPHHCAQEGGNSIAETARLVPRSPAQVKRVWQKAKKENKA
jgi:DNA invertase Pin-like site-specific DNA recombinase